MKLTNDLKKGDRVLLSYGEQNGDIVKCDSFERYKELKASGASYKAWEATVMDNKKGNTRLLEVYGWETDLGSVYSHQILAYWDGSDWQPITHTPKQLKLKELVEKLT